MDETFNYGKGSSSKSEYTKAIKIENAITAVAGSALEKEITSIIYDMEMLNESNEKLGHLLEKSVELAEKLMKSTEKLTEKIDRVVTGYDDEIITGLWKSIKDLPNDFRKKALEGIAEEFKDAWEEINSLASSSVLTDSTARTNQFQYGLSYAESQAMADALSIIGVSSIEDLLYYGDEAQRAKFSESFSKYVEKYNELYDSGLLDDVREFEYEWAEFKNDLLLEFMQFFVEHKDTISTALEAIITVTDFIIDMFDWAFNANDVDTSLSEEQKAMALSNALGVTNLSNTVTVSNSFTNVGAADKAWITNSVDMAYEQIIQAMGEKG